jgi:hypothetical protein
MVTCFQVQDQNSPHLRGVSEYQDIFVIPIRGLQEVRSIGPTYRFFVRDCRRLAVSAQSVRPLTKFN